MPLIGAEEARRLRTYFEAHLQGEVAVELFVEAEALSPRCLQTRAFIEEIVALSPKLRLRVHPAKPEERASRFPIVALSGGARGRPRFVGMPLGHEIVGLLEDLLDVSRGRSDLDEAIVKELEGLSRDVHLELLVTADCPFCPVPARLIHRMAIASPRLTADVVAIDQFPELAGRADIEGVPTLLVNGEVAVAGMQPPGRVLGEILARSRLTV